MRILTMLTGILFMGAGIFLIANSGITFLSVAFPTGLAFMIAGVVECLSYSSYRGDNEERTWILIDGTTTFMLGALIILNKLTADAVVPTVLGLWVITTGIRNFVMFIPGTYGTVLFRRFFMGGAVEEIAKYAPAEAVSALRDAFDFNLYFFGNSVSPAVCVAVLGGSVILLAAAYYLIVHFSARRKKRGKLNTPRSR